VCVPECPVNAIYAEEDLPEDQREFVQINRDLALLWPTITKSIAPPEDAEQWSTVKLKRHLIDK
jgi:ferredoxin